MPLGLQHIWGFACALGSCRAAGGIRQYFRQYFVPKSLQQNT
jgi:hypothetical protein